MQGQDGEVRWVMYQLGYIATGMLGVIGVGVSGCWLAHIIVYMLPPVPIHPLLNDVFIKLDNVFPLFGVGAFAAFCGYLMSECPRVELAIVCALCLMRRTEPPRLQHVPVQRQITSHGELCALTSVDLLLFPSLLHAPACSCGNQGQLFVGPQLPRCEPVPHPRGRHPHEQLPGQHRPHPGHELCSHTVLCERVFGLRQQLYDLWHIWQPGG